MALNSFSTDYGHYFRSSKCNLISFISIVMRKFKNRDKHKTGKQQMIAGRRWDMATLVFEPDNAQQLQSTSSRGCRKKKACDYFSLFLYEHWFFFINWINENTTTTYIHECFLKIWRRSGVPRSSTCIPHLYSATAELRATMDHVNHLSQPTKNCTCLIDN